MWPLTNPSSGCQSWPLAKYPGARSQTSVLSAISPPQAGIPFIPPHSAPTQQTHLRSGLHIPFPDPKESQPPFYTVHFWTEPWHYSRGGNSRLSSLLAAMPWISPIWQRLTYAAQKRNSTDKISCIGQNTLIKNESCVLIGASAVVLQWFPFYQLHTKTDSHAKLTRVHTLTDSSETPLVSVPDFFQILQFLSLQINFISNGEAGEGWFWLLFSCKP